MISSNAIKVQTNKIFKTLANNGYLDKLIYKKKLVSNYDPFTDKNNETYQDIIIQGIISSFKYMEIDGTNVLKTDTKLTFQCKYVDEISTKDLVLFNRITYNIIDFSLDHKQDVYILQLRSK